MGGAHRAGKAGPNLAVSYFRTVPWGPRTKDIGGGESGRAEGEKARLPALGWAGRRELAVWARQGLWRSVCSTVLPRLEGHAAWPALPVRGIGLSELQTQPYFTDKGQVRAEGGGAGVRRGQEGSGGVGRAAVRSWGRG